MCFSCVTGLDVAYCWKKEGRKRSRVTGVIRCAVYTLNKGCAGFDNPAPYHRPRPSTTTILCVLMCDVNHDGLYCACRNTPRLRVSNIYY